MKPIKARSFFVRDLLFALAALFTVVGFVFIEKTLPLSYGIFGQLKDGNLEIPILLGQVRLIFLTTFLSYICIYLIFEFYGLKSALYPSLSLPLVVIVCYFLFSLVKKYLLEPVNYPYDEVIDLLLKHDLQGLLAFVVPLFLGFLLCLCLAALIKRLTRNYFMFIRFFLASTMGFAVYVSLHHYLKYFGTYGPRSLMVYLMTPAAQFLLMIVVSVVPLYLLRLFLGMFRGWQAKEDVEEMPKKAGLFKTDGVISSSSDGPQKEIPTTDVLVPTSNEKTISKKVSFL